MAEKEKNDKKEDALSNAPIDRGWAWVVLAAAIFQVSIYGGIMKSYGIFFVEFQKRFQSSASETSVMQTIQNLVVSFAGIFVMNIGMKYMSARTSVCIGTIGMASVYLGSAFATDIRILNLAIGFFGGLFNTMVFLPIVSLIGIYFNARRGLANSLYVSGAPFGGLVLGPVFTSLFDNIGYTGTMMLTSAMLLNMLISGCLMRPIEFFTKRSAGAKGGTKAQQTEKAASEFIEERSDEKKCPEIRNNGSDHPAKEQNSLETGLTNGNNVNPSIPLTSISDREQDSGSEEDETTANVNAIAKSDIEAAERRQLVKQTSNPEGDSVPHNSPGLLKRLPHIRAPMYHRTVSYDPDIRTNQEHGSPLLARARANTNISLRKRTVSELSHNSALGSVVDSICRSKIALFTSGEINCESMINVSSIANPQTSTNNLNDNSPSDSRKDTSQTSIRAKILDFLKTQFNVNLLKEPVFIHYLCLAFLSLPSSIMVNVYMIPHGKDIGITNQQAGVLLSVVGCTDLVSRVGVGIFADKKWLKPSTIVAIANILLCILCNLMRFVTSFWTLLAAVIIQGCFSGMYIALYAVILVDNMGLGKFKSCLGFTAMVHGVANAALFPLTGLLRDVTGSYYWTYHLLGLMFVLSASLNLTLPLTYKWQKSKKEQNDAQPC